MATMIRLLLAIAFSFLLLFTSMTKALPTELEGYDYAGLSSPADEGVTYVPMTFVGPVVVGGDNVTLQGDYQTIVAEIRILNPAYDDMAPPVNKTVGSSLAQNGGLSDCAGVICGDRAPYPPASQTGLQDSINYLMHRIWMGVCHLPAGPRTCSRVSCSWDSAVVWCNDEHTDIWVDCDRLGVYAQSAMDECLAEPMRTMNYVNGQCFAKGSAFNLNIGMDQC